MKQFAILSVIGNIQYFSSLKSIFFNYIVIYIYIGISGEKITLQTNYFKLLTTPNWCLYKYRVDFEPEEERTVVRKGLLRVHQKKIDPYIFDGTVLYTSTRLPDVKILRYFILYTQTNII